MGAQVLMSLYDPDDLQYLSTTVDSTGKWRPDDDRDFHGCYNCWTLPACVVIRPSSALHTAAEEPVFSYEIDIILH